MPRNYYSYQNQYYRHQNQYYRNQNQYYRNQNQYYKKPKKSSHKLLFTFSIILICTSIAYFVRGNLTKNMSTIDNYNQKLFNSGYNDTAGLIYMVNDNNIVTVNSDEKSSSDNDSSTIDKTNHSTTDTAKTDTVKPNNTSATSKNISPNTKVSENNTTKANSSKSNTAKDNTTKADSSKTNSSKAGSSKANNIKIDNAITRLDCSDNIKEQIQIVVDIVNKERTAAGLGTLTVTYELCNAAIKRSDEIVTKFEHTRPDGSSCFTIFKELKVPEQPAGENIAAGYPNAEIVMNGWMHSEGHKANILNKGFKKIGVGLVINKEKYNYYWTQVFAW